MPWIRTIEPEEATGPLAEAYGWQARKLGRPTEFTQLGSLAPELVHARLVLYRASENVPSRLGNRQRLLISYLASVLNETPHCVSGLRLKLESLGVPLAFIDRLCSDPRTVRSGGSAVRSIA